MSESQAVPCKRRSTPGIEAVERRPAESTESEWDAALYRALLARFSQRYEGFPQRSAELFASGHFARLGRELGQLSSGARKLGAGPLADLAAKLKDDLPCDSTAAFIGMLAELSRVLEATVRIIERRVWTAPDPFGLAAARGLSEPTARSRRPSAR